MNPLLSAALRLCVIIPLSGCAGYDVKVGADYQDRNGDQIGVNVDVSKETITPTRSTSSGLFAAGGFAK